MRRLSFGFSRCFAQAPGFSSDSCRRASTRTWKSGADADHDFSFGCGVCLHSDRWNRRQFSWRSLCLVSGVAVSIPCASSTLGVLASLPAEHVGKPLGVSKAICAWFLKILTAETKDSAASFCKHAAVFFRFLGACVRWLRRGNGVCHLLLGSLRTSPGRGCQSQAHWPLPTLEQWHG